MAPLTVIAKGYTTEDEAAGMAEFMQHGE